MNVYLLIGLPGSGKSTWCKEFVKDKDNTIIVNRDSFRTMIKDDYTFNFRYEPLIKQSSNKMIETALEYGFDIIVDETHVKSERRKEIVNLVRNFENSFGMINDDYGKTKIIFMWFTENQNNIHYRMKESRGYEFIKWEEIINNMKKIFEEPLENEGYDELIKINSFPFIGVK